MFLQLGTDLTSNVDVDDYPIAGAIVQYGSSKGIKLFRAWEFREVPGSGAMGMMNTPFNLHRRCFSGVVWRHLNGWLHEYRVHRMIGGERMLLEFRAKESPCAGKSRRK